MYFMYFSSILSPCQFLYRLINCNILFLLSYSILFHCHYYSIIIINSNKYILFYQWHFLSLLSLCLPCISCINKCIIGHNNNTPQNTYLFETPSVNIATNIIMGTKQQIAIIKLWLSLSFEIKFSDFVFSIFSPFILFLYFALLI